MISLFKGIDLPRFRPTDHVKEYFQAYKDASNLFDRVFIIRVGSSCLILATSAGILGMGERSDRQISDDFFDQFPLVF